MPARKRTKKPGATKPTMLVEPTPWDLVNVLGYALGVEQSVLEYASRSSSHYNFAYCEKRPALKSLRNACQLRQTIMQNYEELDKSAQAAGAFKLPSRITGPVRRLFNSKAKEFTNPADMFLAIQTRIVKTLPRFQAELPKWFHKADLLLTQFHVSDVNGPGDVGKWCLVTAAALGDRVYMHDYARLSSRVLRDDRDLIEELCELHGVRADCIEFPYSRHKSNRTAHMERLQKFCNSHGPVVVEIDTENVGFAPVIAFLQRLEEIAPKAISKVNVYLTGMEGTPWRHISESIKSPVDYREITRIRAQKSVVDTAIIASVLKTRYEGTASGVLLISSDCDFLVLNQQIPDYPVCYCCFQKQVAASTIQYLKKNSIPSVYVDYVVNDLMTEKAGRSFITQHVARAIETSIPNIKGIMKTAALEVCTTTGLMSYNESLESLLQTIELGIAGDGRVTATIRKED